MNFIDLTGKTFGLLKVIGLDANNKKPGIYWMCECECQKNERVPKQRPIRQDKLLNGKTLSCGCLKEKQKTRGKHKTNTFNLERKFYVIGTTANGEKFYFDKEDYELVTSVSKCWHYNDGGYLAARDKRINAKRYSNGQRKLVYLKDIIMNKQEGEKVKYKNYLCKGDNRKSNLVKVCGGENIGRK